MSAGSQQRPGRTRRTNVLSRRDDAQVAGAQAPHASCIAPSKASASQGDISARTVASEQVRRPILRRRLATAGGSRARAPCGRPDAGPLRPGAASSSMSSAPATRKSRRDVQASRPELGRPGGLVVLGTIPVTPLRLPGLDRCPQRTAPDPAIASGVALPNAATSCRWASPLAPLCRRSAFGHLEQDDRRTDALPASRVRPAALNQGCAGRPSNPGYAASLRDRNGADNGQADASAVDEHGADVADVR
jgi:hypothetical protein